MKELLTLKNFKECWKQPCSPKLNALPTDFEF